MTEKMYSIVWNETEKAMKYLHKKGCMSLYESIPSGYGDAHLFICKVSDADENMKNHVRKNYPNAKIEFVDRETVVYGQLKKDIAFAEYRMSL